MMELVGLPMKGQSEGAVSFSSFRSCNLAFIDVYSELSGVLAMPARMGFKCGTVKLTELMVS
ncbi:hypothetical protein [Photobacterium lipolyticum]|uniref:Uncharacterized protein n=1 Tax=Photobacterium lipolyticum TaxID=266810 RepID=A0A2T3N1M5_9GAMM|nr:hypothetical protein [Photobacterium lipolyticum]PSW06178.1 hypothetical protein C9I89_06625 [Photobacterium lipolyticum]